MLKSLRRRWSTPAGLVEFARIAATLVAVLIFVVVVFFVPLR